MKKRLISLLCALSLLCAASLLVLPSSVRAEEGEGQKAADMLLSMDFISTESAGPLDKKLIGENLNKAATQLDGVAMLVRLSGADTSSSRSLRLPGVPEDMSRDLGYAAEKGWVDTAGFEAESPLSAKDWFSMVLRLLGYNDFEEEDAPLSARRMGLVSSVYDGNLTGADLAETALAILRAPYRDGTGTVVAKLILKGKTTSAAFSLLGLSGRGLSVRETADRYMPAVFGMDLESSDSEDKDGVQASGFFVTADGIAATCFHSIQGTTKGTATLVTGEKFEVASVLWSDQAMDLALIRISNTSQAGKRVPAFAYLETAKMDTLRPGDMSYSIGYPLGVALAVNQGVINSAGVKVERYSLPCIISAASISPGSGGGVLMNAFGKAVGVTSGAFEYGNETYISIPAEAIGSALKNVGGGGSPLSSLPAPEKKSRGKVEVEGECEVEINGEKRTVKGTFVVKEEEPDLKSVVDY